MERQDSGDTGSYDKKKNEDDEAEATLPPTDGMTVWIPLDPEWEEKIRRWREGMTSRDKECITCKWQCPRNEDFCACHRKLTPIIDRHKFQLKSSPAKARPGSSSLLPDPTWANLSGGDTSTMHNHGSSGEVIGFAHEDGDIEMAGMHSPGHTLCHPALTPSLPNVSNEITSEPSQADLSASDSPPTVKSSRQLQLLNQSLDRDHGEPYRVLNVPCKDSDIEIGGTHSLDHVQGGPTLVLWGDSSSHGFADEDSGIEMGGTHSSDGVPGEPRLVDLCSYHHAHEDTWQRLADMVDPLLAVNVQGAFSLVAYKSTDGSSPAKDVLLYLVVFLYVLGFLSALGGKFYRCAKMGVIGLVAAALGFLMTMALVVIYKI